MILARPMAHALDAVLSDARENIEDSAAVLATVGLPVKAQSVSSVRIIETGKMKSEGNDMQMILVEFCEPQEDFTLKCSSTTINF